MFIHTIRYSVSAFPTGQMQTKQNKTQSGQQKKKGGGEGRGVGGLKLRKLVKKKKVKARMPDSLIKPGQKLTLSFSLPLLKK